jgi:hypothetical protein
MMKPTTDAAVNHHGELRSWNAESTVPTNPAIGTAHKIFAKTGFQKIAGWFSRG